MPNEPSNEKLEQRAKNVLLFQLSRSMKTRYQLANILKKREIPDEIAEAVLDRFTEAQLIDDAAFARAFVNSRLAISGKSKSVIARELKQKGVSADDAAAAAADAAALARRPASSSQKMLHFCSSIAHQSLLIRNAGTPPAIPAAQSSDAAPAAAAECVHDAPAARPRSARDQTRLRGRQTTTPAFRQN